MIAAFMDVLEEAFTELQALMAITVFALSSLVALMLWPFALAALLEWFFAQPAPTLDEPLARAAA